MVFPLPEASPEGLGLDPVRIAQLEALIARHVEQGRHPGAQLAIARHGRLALFRCFGDAVVAPRRATAPDTLFLLYSNTKVLTAAAIWTLVEAGALRFADTVAAHVPEFAAHGKGAITIAQLLTHQAGFPGAEMPAEGWTDAAFRRRAVCDFTLEWTPGSRLHYHPAAAHWVLAVVIEAITGEDFRTAIADRVIAPIGLGAELRMGLPVAEQHRAAAIHDPPQDGRFPERLPECSPEGRAAGIPGGGGYGTARGMAAFYQMLLAGGVLGAARILSPRMIAHATRNHTGDQVDAYVGLPMHRGLGPHVRGETPTIRGLGAIAHPRVFGHGGVGSSYCWGDPDSGVSFAFLSNCRQAEPFHTERMDALSNLAHAAILPMPV